MRLPAVWSEVAAEVAWQVVGQFPGGRACLPRAGAWAAASSSGRLARMAAFGARPPNNQALCSPPLLGCAPYILTWTCPARPLCPAALWVLARNLRAAVRGTSRAAAMALLTRGPSLLPRSVAGAGTSAFGDLLLFERSMQHGFTQHANSGCSCCGCRAGWRELAGWGA